MRVTDVAFVRFAAPDLDRMESFIRDFGMAPFRRDGMLFARGAGPAPFAHVTEQGDPRFVALGLVAPSVEDLRALARREAVDVRPSPWPGGGEAVVLVDPDGFQVEVIAGWETGQSQSVVRSAQMNDAIEKRRIGSVKRCKAGPSQVFRIGHCVLAVTDFRTSEAWYKERFGFITSDEIILPDGSALGAFMRCDRGDDPTDHHSLFLMQAPGAPAFHHAAFEIKDSDDLFVGHEWLEQAGWTPHWGVGRHILGSQIFDYWRDPWGHTLEHWTDGDLLTASDGSCKTPFSELRAVQWGHSAPHAS